MLSQWRSDRGARGVFAPWQDGSDNKKRQKNSQKKDFNF